MKNIIYSSIFTMGCPMPESTLTLCQSLFYSLVSDFDLASGSILGLVVRGAEWGGMSFGIQYTVLYV
jgi:hypothetical protein